MLIILSPNQLLNLHSYGYSFFNENIFYQHYREQKYSQTLQYFKRRFIRAKGTVSCCNKNTFEKLYSLDVSEINLLFDGLLDQLFDLIKTQIKWFDLIL